MPKEKRVRVGYIRAVICCVLAFLCHVPGSPAQIQFVEIPNNQFAPPGTGQDISMLVRWLAARRDTVYPVVLHGGVEFSINGDRHIVTVDSLKGSSRSRRVLVTLSTRVAQDTGWRHLLRKDDGTTLVLGPTIDSTYRVSMWLPVTSSKATAPATEKSRGKTWSWEFSSGTVSISLSSISQRRGNPAVAFLRFLRTERINWSNISGIQ